MIIKKIELQGFKSFPERTKIVFHPGITCVVGPNGTGKSNIVDALLWVLGGQKSKSLKGERSEDIIFNGNNQRPPLGMADVVLSLTDDDEDFLINHRVFRSGESEYRLNGKQVRLKDIQDALWNRGIAEKEYFVIEQGQIGLFLTSKPTEKRLLLEEAAGTAYYKAKKKQAQNKLESSEQNLLRLEDIIEEVSRAKNSLKRQASAAIRYRKLREKIRQLTSLHYHKKIITLEKNLKEITGHFEECSSREKEAISLLKTEEKNLANKRKDVWDLEKSIQEEQKRIYSLNSEISRLETDREKAIERIERLEEQKKRDADNIDEINQELLQLETENSEIEENLRSFRKEQTQQLQALTSAEKQNQTSQEELENWTKEIDDIRNEYFQRLSEHTEIKNEKVKIEKEIELLQRQKQKLETQLGSEIILHQEKDKVLEERGKSLAETQRLRDEKRKTIVAHQKELDNILASLEGLHKKISGLNQKKEEELHHLHALEKLKEKERGAETPVDIPGSLGILADLMTTDAEHAPLIDIFWKEEAKAMLVHAQDFMEILTEKELKGHFIILAPQKKADVSSKAYQDSRVLGLLTSYLQPSPKIKDHLSQFQEAAIVKDVKSAIELWLLFPSINFVTLQGDVLLSTGLLKMGRKKEGVFTLSQEIEKVKGNIDRLEKKIEPMSIEQQEEAKTKQRLEEEIEKESTRLDQLERKIAELENDKALEQSEKAKIEANMTLLKNEIVLFGKEIEVLSDKLKELSLEQLEEEEKAIKEKLESAEKKFVNHQEKTEEKRQQVFEHKSNLDLIEEKIRNLNQREKNIKEREKTLGLKLKSLQDEIQNCDLEKQRLKENIEDLIEKTNSQKKEREEKEQTLVQSESHLQKIKKEQDELEEKIEQHREESEARKEERVKWEISKAEKDRDLVNLEESCWQDLKKTLQEVKEEIPDEKIPEAEVEKRLTEAEERLQSFKSVNLMAEEEYEIQKNRYDFLMKQKQDLRESIDTTKQAIKKIDKESKTQFMKALKKVNINFQEVFSLLFNGGQAELKLSEPNNPLESGVDIIAQPPGKKVQTLSLLSGGEKSLTSLAFFFALFRYKPTPFCVLDEVDAALDEVNLKRFLDLMKKIKTQTQFIIITHNFKTMEVADYIHGTTMAEPNITNLYSIKLEKKELQSLKNN